MTRTLLEGETRSRRSVTNVGMRPTFNGSALTVETHLLDYSGEVPAKHIEVRFWKRLREEKKFTGPEDLRAQIAKDILDATRFFALAPLSLRAPARLTRGTTARSSLICGKIRRAGLSGNLRQALRAISADFCA